jgi:4-hydroxy-tetrahydrodipicolinate synthase
LDPIFTGVGVALVTLFEDDGELDPFATAEHAGLLVDRGIEAIIVAGTTGEAAALTQVEQAQLTAAVKAAVGDEVPIIAGVRGEDADERAIEAAAAGVDAILALSPPDHLDAYYDEIAAVGVPVLAYHFPAVSPPGIPVDALPRLPVVGLKDSGGNLERLKAEVAIWERAVYTGASSAVRAAGEFGATGAILAIANLEPELSIAAFEGDEDAQSRLESLDIPTLKARMRDKFGTSRAVRL